MKPHQRPRVARRRDDEIRRIRTDSTPRYPGTDAPAVEETPESPSAPAEEGRKLAPARDTGLAVHRRADRAAAAAEKRRRAGLLSVVAIIIALIGAAIGWRQVSDRAAAARPITAPDAAATTSEAVSAVSSKSSVRPAATPVFASYKSLKLRLPVPVMQLSEIGFHQASYSWALRLKTPMKDADMKKAAKTKTTGRDRKAQPTGPDAVMTGKVLRMWRNRPGKPDTAVDVGALAGTTVLSPVNGTVVRIKPYELYGRYSDYELHIIPDNTSGLDVVMIHLTDLKCKAGDHLEAGITPVAKIRKLSDKFHDQLADYTRDPGDHVHMQVNDSDYPGYKGLKGAIEAEGY